MSHLIKSVGAEGLETRNLTSEVHVRPAALRAGRALGGLGAWRPERALAPSDGGGLALERDGGGGDVPAHALAMPAHLPWGGDETRPVSTGGGTRRVQLVREGGGRGGGLRWGGVHARRCGRGYARILTFREVSRFPWSGPLCVRQLQEATSAIPHGVPNLFRHGGCMCMCVCGGGWYAARSVPCGKEDIPRTRERQRRDGRGRGAAKREEVLELCHRGVDLRTMGGG